MMVRTFSTGAGRVLWRIVLPNLELVAMPEVAARLGTDEDVVARMRVEYEKHLKGLRANGEGPGEDPVRRAQSHYTALRDERRIDDTVLRQVQTKLDVEEVRLSRREILD